MQFINRRNELDTLNSQYERNESSLVIIYGRRRVGKTALINEFISDKKALYFLATEEAEKINLDSFKESAATFLDNELMRAAQSLSWETIIKELCKAGDKEKQILVIDEFQYLGSANKAFPSLFQKLWDLYLSKSNMMVILCGSLISMMVDQTLSYTSPLYGRRTAQMKLKQIPFMHYHEFVPDKTNNELIEHFAVTGGVPKYIEMFKSQATVNEGVINNIFNKDGFLYEEPSFLLNKEVTNPSTYRSIIDIVATRGRKMAQISALLEMKRQNVTHHMNTLMDLDLIERVVPITTKNPEKSKQVEFHLKDNFLFFWFNFVLPFKGDLERGYTENAIKNLESKFFDKHVRYVYEHIAAEKIYNYQSQGVLPPLNKIGRWWDNEAKIDVVALNEETGHVVFGECKYKNSKMDISDLRKLMKSSTRVKVDFTLQKEIYILFSKSGFTEELMEMAKVDSKLLLVHGTQLLEMK